MSQRVDFYLLEDDQPQSGLMLACRLLEKAWLRGHRVFVYCKDQSSAEQLDELLWTFKDDSFIPHNLQGEGPEPPPPVQIGYGDEPRGYNDVLLNLSDTIPPFFPRFKRILEIVVNTEEAKTSSRNRYRDYRSQRCSMHTHPIS